MHFQRREASGASGRLSRVELPHDHNDDNNNDNDDHNGANDDHNDGDNDHNDDDNDHNSDNNDDNDDHNNDNNDLYIIGAVCISVCDEKVTSSLICSATVASEIYI